MIQILLFKLFSRENKLKNKTMKKLLLLITLLSVLSCKKAVTLEESKIDIQKEKVIRINGREWYLTTASDGHEYIDNSGYHDYMCMHYVDCKKCAKN